MENEKERILKSAQEADAEMGTIVPIQLLKKFEPSYKVGSSSMKQYSMLPNNIMIKMMINKGEGEDKRNGQIEGVDYFNFKRAQEGYKEREIEFTHLKTTSIYSFLADNFPSTTFSEECVISDRPFNVFTGILGVQDFIPLLLLLFEFDPDNEFLDFKTMPSLMEHYRSICKENMIEGTLRMIAMFNSIPNEGAPQIYKGLDFLPEVTKIFTRVNELMEKSEKVEFYFMVMTEKGKEVKKQELTLTEALDFFSAFVPGQFGFGDNAFSMLGGEEEVKGNLGNLIREYYREKINQEETVYIYLNTYLIQMESEIKSEGNLEKLKMFKRMEKWIYRQIIMERILFDSLETEEPSIFTQILQESKINFGNLPRIGLEQYLENNSKGAKINLLGVFCNLHQSIQEFMDVYSQYRTISNSISSTNFVFMPLEVCPNSLKPNIYLADYHEEITRKLEYLNYNDGYIVELDRRPFGEESFQALAFLSMSSNLLVGQPLTNLNTISMDGIEGEKKVFVISQEMYYSYIEEVVRSPFCSIHIIKKELQEEIGDLLPPTVRTFAAYQDKLKGIFVKPIIEQQDKRIKDQHYHSLSLINIDFKN